MDEQAMAQFIKSSEPELMDTAELTDDQLSAYIDEAQAYVAGFPNVPADIKDLVTKLYACHLIAMGDGENITATKVGQIMIEHDDNSKATDQFLARFNDLISQYSMNGEVLFNAGGEFLDRPIDIRSYPYSHF